MLNEIYILLEGSFDSLIATSSAIYHPKPPSFLWYTTAVIYPQIHEFGESNFVINRKRHACKNVFKSSYIMLCFQSEFVALFKPINFIEAFNERILQQLMNPFSNMKVQYG